MKKMIVKGAKKRWNKNNFLFHLDKWFEYFHLKAILIVVLVLIMSLLYKYHSTFQLQLITNVQKESVSTQFCLI